VDGTISEISLGKVEVLKKDGISLKDIDPENIPEFLDVIIEPREKEIFLIGRKIKSGHLSSDSQNHSLEKAVLNLDSAKKNNYIHDVKDQLFHEKSLQEFQDEEKYFFDVDLNLNSWRTTFRDNILNAPLILLVLCGVLAADDIYKAMNNAYLLEVQELKALEKYKNELLAKQVHYTIPNFE
jgi:hypothetical protein